MSEVMPSVLGAIGATPLVRLDRLTAHHGVDGAILAKLDYLNPGFSKKDRAALGVIDAAEASGALAPGQTVVELTSGNMGTGLAIVCTLKGYPFVAVMSRGNSPERARMMAALGAEVVLVDQVPGSVPGAVSGADLAEVERASREITIARGAFRADQFAHAGNPLSHERGTGAELIAAAGEQITAFCDFVGSGGTFAGVTRALKAYRADIACHAVEPEGAAVLAGHPVQDLSHPIQGGGYAMAELRFFEDLKFDGFVQVTGETARRAARDLARLEGIFAGFSAGANVAGALELLRGSERGGTVAVVICDSGLKYLSTDLFA